MTLAPPALSPAKPHAAAVSISSRPPRSLPARAAIAFAAIALSVASAAPALAADYSGADYSDPFRTRELAPPPPLAGFSDSASGGDMAPCRFDAQPSQPPLTLADVIDRALCNNPQTRLAWANARAQAAQVGIARSAYLPSLNASVTASRSQSSNTAANAEIDQAGAGLSASWVLYDFGARDAALDNALQSLAASRHTQDATLQKVFLSAVQAYYNLFANRAAVDSALEAERRAQESLKAAVARYEAGTGTPAGVYERRFFTGDPLRLASA